MNVKSVTIEHWYPQNPDSEDEIGQGLDYRNMLAVCSGNRGCGNKKNTTCDAHRGNSELKVNPCDYRTLQKISYRSDGRIFSSDKDINKDLNDILNLNCQAISLPENRKQVLNQLLLDIKKKCPKGDIKQYCLFGLDLVFGKGGLGRYLEEQRYGLVDVFLKHGGMQDDFFLSGIGVMGNGSIAVNGGMDTSTVKSSA